MEENGKQQVNGPRNTVGGLLCFNVYPVPEGIAPT